MLRLDSTVNVLASVLVCLCGCVGNDELTSLTESDESMPVVDATVSEQILFRTNQRITMVRQSMSDDEIIDVLALRKFGPRPAGTIAGMTSSHGYAFSECDCKLVIFRSYDDFSQTPSRKAYEIRFSCPDYPSPATFEVPEGSPVGNSEAK